MDESIAAQVRRRARYACEYCRMPQRFYPTILFPIDHVIAKQHRGPTELHNLSLSCLHCNSHKGPNIAGIDPKSKKLTRLFHPRRHKWSRHFRWNGPYLLGRTTILVLSMNHPELVEVRSAIQNEGFVFPQE